MREGSSGGVTKSKARPVKVRNKAASLSGGGTFLVSDTVVN
jgi:hypothetical protein